MKRARQYSGKITMFKKKCPRCARKITKDFDFCPHCAHDFRLEKRRESERDYGFLGKDEVSENFPNMTMGMPLNLNGLFNSKLFDTLFKEVDKQFRDMDKDFLKDKKKSSGISINISMDDGNKPDIKVSGFGPDFKKIGKEIKEKKIPKSEISDETARRFSKFPKKEAKTEVRRFSNRIVYEINLPGVNNLREVIINKLENGVEIKAFSKDTAYFKIIPVNFPISDYELEDEKLILEFATR
jgi:hypothetical protein